jgi:hypothetical protein
MHDTSSVLKDPEEMSGGALDRFKTASALKALLGDFECNGDFSTTAAMG